MVHWRSQRSLVGHAGDDTAFCAVHRRGDFRDFSADPCGRGWIGLDNGPFYGRAFPGRRDHCRTGY